MENNLKTPAVKDALTRPDSVVKNKEKENVVDKTSGANNPGESKILLDPDTTGGDTKADKTKVEIFPVEQKIK